jgi:hypothetical protein
MAANCDDGGSEQALSLPLSGSQVVTHDINIEGNE